MNIIMDVRNSFIEFWPNWLQELALPHLAISLRPDEAEAVRRCHRLGNDADDQLIRLAGRATDMTNGRPFFMRLGYGSWAGPQLTCFQTLKVDDAQRAHDTLTLRDLRLAEINRRWVRGYDLQLFLRPFLELSPQDEIRTQISNAKLVKAWLRHAPTTICAPPEEAMKVATDFTGLDHYFADFIRMNGKWHLSDINPIFEQKQAAT
ncbi:hypothetical protein [Yoonia sp. 2307UL14-13]|uniref:hypothetical protein n=1 Tax=Yoonia sp. 2307UL14-13 TaxID=3126506 RepID=UPI0030B733F9